MKSIKYFLFALAMVAGIGGLIVSCTKDDAPNNGEPRILYVRVTNPASSDSLLVGAGQGQLIAIIGENLGGAVEVWFNDQQALLTPTYITNTSLLVSVPSQIPIQVSNTLKIVFKNGHELLYDFEVQISAPVIKTMDCEFVNEGDVAVIRGDYFYEPLTVTFEGGVTGELVSVSDQEINVRVPAGAQPGKITVTTNFGETKSGFLFRDDRPKFIDSDPYEGWWDGSLVVSNPGPNDPPKISGNYLRYSNNVGSWSWKELAGGPASSMPNHSKNIPDEAFIKPSDYYLKFEVNTLKPYNGNLVKINVGLTSEDNGGYGWAPPFDTKGKWQTVAIPLDEVFAQYATMPQANAGGYWARIVVGNAPGAWDADIAFDNLRVVLKTVK